jgi:glycosyltransferase involved in cell wall biosynthesis
MKLLLTADPLLPVPPRGYGGIERIVDGLAEELRSRGHQVALLARRDSTCEVDRLYPWPVDRVDSAGAIVRNAAALRRAAGDFRPDVVHSFSRLAFLAGVLPARIPKVMSYQRHPGERQVRWARRLARSSLRFTGCSEYVCILGRRGGGAWRAIPNFVDPTRYTFVPSVAPDAPLVFLSRLEAIKGPHLAIEIARRSGRKLILAGNRTTTGGESRYFDEQIAPALGRDGIEWIGEVDDTQKNLLLGQAAALLVPIQWDEPFGIVFIEAMATGTPVLTCSRGALPEIVEPGETGFFFESAMDGALAVDRLRSLSRARCRAVVETQFSAAACGDQYLGLYETMLSAARGEMG